MSVAYVLEEESDPDIVVTLSAAQMSEIGEEVIKSIKERLAIGVDVDGHQAAPLSESYRKVKLKRGDKPIRDMNLTGATLNSIKVLVSADNTVEIGFDNAEAEKRVLFDAKYDRMWGLATTDGDIAEAATSDQIRTTQSKNRIQGNNPLLIEGD